jgi:hypothetical protein
VLTGQPDLSGGARGQLIRRHRRTQIVSAQRGISSQRQEPLSKLPRTVPANSATRRPARLKQTGARSPLTNAGTMVMGELFIQYISPKLSH